MGKEILRVDNVSMRFNLSKEKIDSIKEYVIKMIKGQVKYQEFWDSTEPVRVHFSRLLQECTSLLQELLPEKECWHLFWSWEQDLISSIPEQRTFISMALYWVTLRSLSRKSLTR